MKRSQIILLLLLGAVTCDAAETKTMHNFNAMTTATPADIVYTNSNKIGTTDFVTYTCSGGTAKFYSYSSRICVCMTGSGAILTTTAINDLDSIRISYLPTEAKSIKIFISTDNSVWQEMTVFSPVNGTKTVKFPVKGDYYLKIQRDNADFYIQQIEYIQQSCNCLRVKIEDR